MPTLETKKAPTSVKLLIIGDSGAGKTGSLAALANAGFELFIQDYDNGLDPLFTYVKDQYKKNVHYVTLQDKIEQTPAGVILGKVDALKRGLALLNDWKDEGTSYGSIYTWNSKRVLVFDSLTFMGNSALRAELTSRGKSNMFKPKAVAGFSDPREIIGDAANVLESLFATLFDDRVKCHVVLLSHVRDINNIGFPSSVGQTLPKVLGRYFNTVLGMKKIGTTRVLCTEDSVLTVKCPVKLPATLPISNGLATVFNAISPGTSPEGVPPGNPEEAKEGK